MGGAIAFRLWHNDNLNIQKLVLDGAPLVPYGFFLTRMMTTNYLRITHKSQQRDKKTLINFEKYFLPKQHLDSFLKIADHMSDHTIRNMIQSLSQNKPTWQDDRDGADILYIHGTKTNEYLSKRSAKQLVKHHPNTTVVQCNGCSHCYCAIHEPSRWLKIVERFFV